MDRIHQPDHTPLYHDSPGVIVPSTPPSHLQVGDRVMIRFADELGPNDWIGSVTETFRGDRYKVEFIGADGREHRFSVPRDLLTLVRRADA